MRTTYIFKLVSRASTSEPDFFANPKVFPATRAVRHVQVCILNSASLSKPLESHIGLQMYVDEASMLWRKTVMTKMTKATAINDRKSTGAGELVAVVWGFARGLARRGRSSPVPGL